MGEHETKGRVAEGLMPPHPPPRARVKVFVFMIQLKYLALALDWSFKLRYTV